MIEIKEYEEFLTFANDLAAEAGQRLLNWFGQVTTSIKRDGTVVTEADLDVDRFIGEAVGRRYPHHGLISEEASLIYQGAEFTWVVDPLDGTTNYANGLPIWGSSIAMLHRGEPVVAVLEFPWLRQRFVAVQGGGAWLNDRRLHVRPAQAVHENQLIDMDGHICRHVEVRLPPKLRSFGSAAYGLAAVAGGMAIASLETRVKVWDIAAGWLIAREAGVAVSTWLSGKRPFPLRPGWNYEDLRFPLLLATDPAMLQRVRAAIRLRPSFATMRQQLEAQGWVFDGE